MEIALTIAVAVLSLLLGISIAAYYRLKARVDSAAKRDSGQDPPKRLEAGGRASPPAAPSADDDDLEIPAALVGARYKEAIERFAPILGTTPVQLLRAALENGLTGNRPITTEMLDMLDALVQAGDIAPPSKPGPSRPN
jgi:hypothetical protein